MSQDFEDQIERCQSLLEELDGLSPEEGLQRLDAMLETPGLSAKRRTPLWALLQELRFHQGQLALQLGQHLRCLRALAHCSWREANELEAETVRTSPSWSGDRKATVLKLRDGSYHLWNRWDNEVEIGRLSAELEPLFFDRLPWSVHVELSEMRDFSEPERDARRIAKIAFELNNAGRAGLALGFLETALEEGLQHPALLPSREALLKKGIVADADARAWIATYRLEARSGRGDIRVTPDAIRQETRVLALASLGAGSRLKPDSMMGRWLQEVERSELRELLRGDQLDETQREAVLLFLGKCRPEAARELLSLFRKSPGLVQYHLQQGDLEKALAVLAELAPPQRWTVLYQWHIWDGQGRVRKTDGTPLMEPARRLPSELALLLPGLMEATARELLESKMGEEQARLQAACWSLENDPEVKSWLGRCQLPTSAQLLACRHLPEAALDWIAVSSDGASAALLWSELAGWEERDQYEVELRRLYPRVLRGCVDGEALQDLIVVAASWNDLPELTRLWREVSDATTKKGLATALSELPEGLEWARQLSGSSDVEERRLAVAVLSLGGHQVLGATGEIELQEHIAGLLALSLVDRTYLSSDGNVGRWFLRAEQPELEELLRGDQLTGRQRGAVLLFLEKWRPEAVRELLPLGRTEPSDELRYPLESASTDGRKAVYPDGAEGIFFQRLREYARFLCVAGFDCVDKVREKLEGVVKQVDDDDPDIGRIEQLMAEELALKAAYEKTFPEVTDCLRLTTAFEALTARGIISIERPGFDITDGWERFHEIAEDWAEQGATAPRGGCFYHEQDLNRALQGEGLSICFGHVEEEEGVDHALGREIVEVLRQHGLVVQWDGDPDVRPMVTLKWQRHYAPSANTDPPIELRTSDPEE